jgi:putative spermidine/putrescine transport system permease protein
LIGAAGGRLAAPAIALIGTVATVALGSLLATGLGLLPLFGSPQWSAAAFSQPELADSLVQSLQIAVPAAGLAAVGGLLTAGVILTVNSSVRWLIAILSLVVATPQLVGATAMSFLLSDAGILGRLLRVPPANWPHLVAGRWPVATVAEFAWKESAFVALVIVASLSGRLAQLHATASTLGANAWQRWWLVTVPQAGPALAGSTLLVFVFTWGNYEVAWLLGRTFPQPLPGLAYRLFADIDLAARPQAAAVAAVTTAASVGIACLWPWRGHQS